MRIPKLLLPLLVLSAAIGYGGPGSIFDFSYTFDSFPGDTFSGTVAGTLNSGVLTLGSVDSVWVNGVKYSAPVAVAGGIDTTTGGLTAPALMSATLTDNNFQLMSSDGTYLFGITPDGFGSLNATGIASTDQMSASDADAIDMNSPSDYEKGWTFSEHVPTSSVPDGGSPALMLAGSFAALALLRKRR